MRLPYTLLKPFQENASQRDAGKIPFFTLFLWIFVQKNTSARLVPNEKLSNNARHFGGVGLVSAQLPFGIRQLPKPRIPKDINQNEIPKTHSSNDAVLSRARFGVRAELR